MTNPPMPTGLEIQAFLEHLQRYRAALSTTGQQQLDAMVAAGLGAEPHATTGAAASDVTAWAMTPWGLAHRYGPWLSGASAMFAGLPGLAAQPRFRRLVE